MVQVSAAARPSPCSWSQDNFTYLLAILAALKDQALLHRPHPVGESAIEDSIRRRGKERLETKARKAATRGEVVAILSYALSIYTCEPMSSGRPPEHCHEWVTHRIAPDNIIR